MSECYLIANLDRRQYLSAQRFNESPKRGGFLRGLHARALALLICRADAVHHDFGALAGSWFGERVLAAGDHHPTAIAAEAGRDGIEDLHQTALREFEDISLAALAMLCQGDPAVVEQLVDAVASEQARAIGIAGDLVFLADATALKTALDRRIGKAWVSRYRRP